MAIGFLEEKETSLTLAPHRAMAMQAKPCQLPRFKSKPPYETLRTSGNHFPATDGPDMASTDGQGELKARGPIQPLFVNLIDSPSGRSFINSSS
jgi:hypothetical protein